MSDFLLSVRQIFHSQFWPHRRYCHVILGQLMRKYDVISIVQDSGRGRSILLPVSYLLMSLPSEGQIYQQTKCRRHISIYGWGITTSGLEKQTSATLEFYFRFRSRPFGRNLHIILHQHPNFVQIGAPIPEMWRHIHFSRWQPRPLNTTSGFVFVDVTAFRISKSIRTKFRRDTSIGGWDITASGFEKQTSAILEFYFRFRYLAHFAVIGVLFCIRLPNFVQIGTSTTEIMTLYRFSRWRPPAMLYLLRSNGGPPTKCLSWSELGPQIACSSN